MERKDSKYSAYSTISTRRSQWGGAGDWLFNTPFKPFPTPPLTDPREESSSFSFSQVNLQDPPNYPNYILRRKEPYNARNHLKRKARSIWVTLTLWAFTFVFIVLYSAYVYQALLSPEPSLGRLLLSASGTNVVVTILSQVFANAADVMIRSFLDHLRWQLAARAGGVSFLAFFGLSSATDWLSVLWFTVGGKVRTMWGAVRLILPILGIFLGSILKLQASFEYYFRPTDINVDVYAGLVEFDTLVLKSTPVNIMTVYFTGWTNTLLNVPQYATHVSLPDCDGALCKGFILPGGLENVRNVDSMLNSTVLQRGLFDNTEVIQIDDAPGFLVKFELMGDNDFKFNVEEDCGFYGASVNDSLQLCLKPVDSSLAVAYSRKDSSIINVETTRPPSDPMVLDWTVYTSLWSTILTPKKTANEVDRGLVNTLVYGLTFALRLYDDNFPDDDNTPFQYLMNWMSIPLQFMVTCFQFANYSPDARELIDKLGPLIPDDYFAMPDEFMTKARSGIGMQRMLGQPWTVLTFIIGGVSVVVLSAVGIIWLLVQREVAPRSSGVPEMDVVARIGETGEFSGPGGGGPFSPGGGISSPRAQQPPPPRPGQLRRVGTSAVLGEEELMTLTDMVKDKGLDRGHHSAWRMSRELRKRKVWLVGEPHADEGDSRRARALLVNREHDGYSRMRSDSEFNPILAPIREPPSESITLRGTGSMSSVENMGRVTQTVESRDENDRPRYMSI